MKEYVVGLLFNANEDDVLLIRKKRPDWQAGFLNGIGGHIQENESPKAAMQREFFEEAGAEIDSHKWNRFVTMKGPDFVCHFFRHILDEETDAVIDHIYSKTDEKVAWYSLDKIKTEEVVVVENLNWLLPLALDPCVKFPIKIESY